MDNWERRTIKACGWLKRNTRRISARLKEFFDWAENPAGVAPPRESGYAYLLNPVKNGTSAWMDELGSCLRHYPRGGDGG